MIKRHLPDYCHPQRKLEAVRGSVVHYFSAINVDPVHAFDFDTCYDLLLDLNNPGWQRGRVMPKSGERRYHASYQYMIDRGGVGYQLLPEDREAYHAGRSTWRGYHNLNRCTIGVALLGTYDSGFTAEQYAALTHLEAQLMTRHHFGVEWIMGHEHVAPGRKKDPGPMFDWERLKEPLMQIQYGRGDES